MKLITPNEITCVCKSTLSFKEINLILCNLTIVFAYHVVQFSRTKFASLYQCVSSKQLIYYSMLFRVCQALFFKIFLNRFGSASRNFLTSSPFGCLSDRSGVPLSDSSIIIPRQLLFVNTFFTLFLTFFEKSCFFPFSSLFPAILRPPIPTLPPLYFFAPFCYNV